MDKLRLPETYKKTSKDTYLTVTDCGISGGEMASPKAPARIIERRSPSPEYSIVFAEKGSISAIIGETEFSVPNGSIILFFPGTPRIIITDSCDSLYRYIDFKGYAIPEILERCGISGSGIYTVSDTRIASDALSRMMFAKNRNGSQVRINALFLTLISEITVSEQEKETATIHCLSGLERIRTAVTLMDAEYKNARRISEYAGMCSMSSARFTTVFEKATGKTPKKYIEDKKIDKACELLMHTAMTISGAAKSSGFEDSLYFSRVFKKRLGMTPSEYRSLPTEDIGT